MHPIGFRTAAVSLYQYLGNMKKTATVLNIGVATIWRWLTNGTQCKQKKSKEFSKALLDFINYLVDKRNYVTYNDANKGLK